MKFCVCIKQVPDVSAPIQVRDGEIVMDAGRVVLNAYDASAVEAALVLTAEHGGTVDVILIGPEKAAEAIRKALAMGADSGEHLVSSGDELDSAAVSKLLAEAVQGRQFDVILTGKQSQDSDAGLTGGMLAERLGVPYATNAVGLEIENDQVIVTRQGDSGQEVLALPTPCLVTCSNDMNDPRIPNLKGIMAAKKKQIASSALSETPGPKARMLRYESIPGRQAGEVLEGDPPEMAATLVARLSAANAL
ncbi:electron transfer flavoprotein subunit beta/FixA family protein [soil metagenome]